MPWYRGLLHSAHHPYRYKPGNEDYPRRDIWFYCCIDQVQDRWRLTFLWWYCVSQCLAYCRPSTEVIKAVNNTTFSLKCNIFSENISCALLVLCMLPMKLMQVLPGYAVSWNTLPTSMHSLIQYIQLNNVVVPDLAVPFSGYKQSGMDCKLCKYALWHVCPLTFLPGWSVLTIYFFRYAQIKAVHVNLGAKL